MNRGGRYAIFKDKNDYSVFLELLREAIEIFHAKVSAFCLMQKHYHLLIPTPGENISRSVRHLRGDTLATHPYPTLGPWRSFPEFGQRTRWAKCRQRNLLAAGVIAHPLF
ncbi:MAG: hypothetical protein GY850_16670 [bacterium]|nr:hypothetical protein [bacterium]